MPDSDPAIAPGTETEDLGRPEAEDLLQEVFGTAIEASAEVFDDLEVEAFRSDHVAVVAPPESSDDAPAGLLSSSLPLRTEDGTGDMAVVDLHLEPAQGHLEPENPLVELEIPTQLSDGISLPESGIRIDLASTAGERIASTVGDASAFFPNTAHDTDFVVTATPTGVETYTQLRSADAPTSQVFELSLPAGHELIEREGGAQVVDANGEAVLDVSPPSALDAAGQRVPANLKVVDHSLVISVDPPADAVYPILVDPLYKYHDWNYTTRYLEWASHADASFTAYDNFGDKGGAITAKTGSVTPGEGYWNFYVPRYWDDERNGLTPTSFIRNMKLWNLYYETAEPTKTWAHPYMHLGLWSDSKGAFVSYGYRDGLEGRLTDPYWVYDLPNPNEVTDVKRGGFALANNTYYNSAGRYVSVGHTSTEVTDKDAPQFSELGTVPEWVGNDAGSAINYQVSDPGLGIHRVRLAYPSASGGSGETITSMGCTGAGFNYCRRSVNKQNKALSYNPSLMAQGENVVKVYASDPIGNQSTVGLSRIKVDHSPPAVSMSGSLTKQATAGTNLSEYDLDYTAKDGDDAAAATMPPAGSAGKNQGQFERPFGVAVAEDGSFYVVDRINNRVVKFDKEGQFALQFGSSGSAEGQFSDPRGIALAADGTVYVTDLGNDRVQAFSPTGAFRRQVKFSDPASQPYAIAVAPNGSLWVTDIGLKRVVGFKDNPVSNIGSVYGKQSNPNDGGTDLASPVGVAVDANNNIWVTDNGISKVLQFDSSRKWKFQFGTSGSGAGQLRGPVGIDIAPSGNIAVMDRDNGRVEIFKPDGTFLRQFGTSGSAGNQLFEAAGLSFGPDNTLVVADTGNKRVARWSHADQDPQSGVAKLEVKVDGAIVHTKAPGCTTKNCSIGGTWTLDADDFSGGAHKVEVIASDAVGNSQTKTLDIETHRPNIGLTGTITQQATLGTTRPSYSLKATASDSSTSGIVGMTIKVDGAVVDSVTPGCPAGGCSITRSWTLNSDTYSVGPHTVEVKATTAAGRLATKTLEIDIARDTTPPEFGSLGAFYTAPSGWLEQREYEPWAIANDTGYGVTSVELKIDGEAVRTLTQPCPAGGCSRFFSLGQRVNMNDYDGGAHPAELIATDGAGNTRKRAWTINVDPSGNISVSEAADTLEAVEVTAPEIDADSPSEGIVVGTPGDDGANPQFVSTEGGFKTNGAEASSSVGGEADDGFVIETEATDESGLINQDKVAVVPVNQSSDASAPAVVNDATVVVANSSPSTDTALRPASDGLMAFQAIRESGGPQHFSWRFANLAEGDTLKLIDERHAGVFWEDGTLALLVTARQAHDAHGTAVPTSLSISGDVLTFNVHHRDNSYVYPVTGGAGWLGGFTTAPVHMPPPEEEEKTGDPYLDGMSLTTTVSPPEPIPASDPDGEASSSSIFGLIKRWGTRACPPDIPLVDECGVWNLKFKGFYYYNFRKAWFPSNRDPRCEPFAAVNFNVTYSECAWVGPNHQPYGAGHHVTARTLFAVTSSYGVTTKTSNKALVGHAYGSGNIYIKNHGRICNPSKPECA